MSIPWYMPGHDGFGFSLGHDPEAHHGAKAASSSL